MRRYLDEQDYADDLAAMDDEEARCAEGVTTDDDRPLWFEEHTHIGGLSPLDRIERDRVRGDRS